MSQYDTTLDLSVSNTSHAQVVSLVPAGSDVLDVGCATGYLAEALNQRGCTVSGVEYDAEAAEKARPHLDHLVVGDLNTMDIDAALGGYVAIAHPAEERRRALRELEAPEITLPDLDGAMHSLHEWHGRKRLLQAFSSW